MDSEATRNKWNSRYRENQENTPDAAEVLTNNVALLPKTGKALDLACGLGANALFLAEQGLEVDAWDISSLAIERLDSTAQKKQLTLSTQVRDCVVQPPKANDYDVIVISRFLKRELCPSISAALHPGGLLFYQTYTVNRTVGEGPNNPDFLLAEGELKRLFNDLHPLFYHEGPEAELVAIKNNARATE